MLETTFSLTHKYQQEQLLADQSFYGNNQLYPMDIYNIIDIIRPVTVLDYGCGNGAAGHALACNKHIDVRLYDPFVKQYSSMPESAEVVICWNVLNNVEVEHLTAVVNNLTELATKHLIVKLPTVKHNSKFYLKYFNHLNIKQLSNEGCNINILVNGTAIQQHVNILTIWISLEFNSLL